MNIKQLNQEVEIFLTQPTYRSFTTDGELCMNELVPEILRMTQGLNELQFVHAKIQNQYYLVAGSPTSDTSPSSRTFPMADTMPVAIVLAYLELAKEEAGF